MTNSRHSQMARALTSPITKVFSRMGLIACLLVQSTAQTTRKPAPAARTNVSDAIDFDSGESEMRPLIERYVVDRGSLARSYPGSMSPTRQARFRQLYSDLLAQIQKLDFDVMSQA